MPKTLSEQTLSEPTALTSQAKLPAAPEGRREANRKRTRQAIIDAIFDLGASNGFDHVSVDQLVEQANISRRTFFNYFSSIEDALTSPTCDFLTSRINRLNDCPEDEEILDIAVALLGDAADDPDFQFACKIAVAARAHPALQRYYLQAWNESQAQLVEGLRPRIVEALKDTRYGQSAVQRELYLRSLVAAVVSCGGVAMELAAEHASQDSQYSPQLFRDYLVRSLSALQSGFALRSPQLRIED